MCHQRDLFQSKLTLSMTSLGHAGLESAQKQDLFKIQNINCRNYRRSYMKSSNERYICVFRNIVDSVEII